MSDHRRLLMEQVLVIVFLTALSISRKLQPWCHWFVRKVSVIMLFKRTIILKLSSAVIYMLVVIYWSIVWELSEDDVHDMTIITTLLPLKLPTNTLIQAIKNIPRSSSKLPSDPPLIFSQTSFWCYGKKQSQDRDDSIIPYLPFVQSSLNNYYKISRDDCRS